jgi:WD40 repeat protein/transcriptional regulator with XRE-family HTH domain
LGEILFLLALGRWKSMNHKSKKIDISHTLHAEKPVSMRTTAYGGRDYTFGQAMLTLRTAIGLTQADLANRLCVSRRAVGEWEAGGSYPKAQHLKEFITLAVKSRAFPSGREAEEIRALWKAAHQKVLLDESWLSTLLGQQSPLQLHLVPAPGQEQEMGVIPRPPTVHVVTPSVSGPRAPVATPRVDWGDTTAVPVFYGREEELARLTRWVVQERCRVVSVLGMGGIGKSALSVYSMYQQVEHFEVVIFRSLRDAPSCEALLDDCLQVLSPPFQGQSHERLSGLDTLEQRISLLLPLLRTQRVLMVLDNLESLLKAGDVRGQFRSGFEGYGQMLRRVAETEHQSCLLFTSREKPAELRSLEGKHSPVRSLRLTGLGVAACKQILEEKGVVPGFIAGGGTEADQELLIERYGGNPLALKIVAETIVDLFGGEIEAFLAEDTTIFGSVTDLLGEQFARLSALEQSVLFWLAIVREPMNLDDLLALLLSGASPPVARGTGSAQGAGSARGATPTVPRMQVLEAIDSGYRRSLIERGKIPGCFTLQSVVLEYVTSVLIAEASREIQQCRLDRLIWHNLFQGHAREYVRQTQERLLLSPLLANLQNAYLGRANGIGRASRTALVEEQLLGLLDHLRSMSDSAQGYGPANLIALLRLLRGNLNGLDLSKLSISGASLQGIEMQGTSLCGALIRDTVFTESVSATWCVAISLDGTLWAAGGMQGKVRVWREGGRTLQLIWQAHADIVMALAFSPDGRTLVSGSQDGTVKLWNLEKFDWPGAGKQEQGVRDSGAISGGEQGDRCRDDPLRSSSSLRRSSLPLQPLSAAVPSGSYVTQGALLWTGWQKSPQHVAFSPDGSLLACSGLGVTVQLWDVQNGTCLLCLEHPAHVFSVTWSPDGRLFASSCFDGLLRLWERQDASPETTILRPSTSWETSPLWSLAFAPDSRTLAGSGWNRKVALWDVASGQLLQTLPGETNRTNRVAWSPDGRTLACCSYEKAIRLWDVEQHRYRVALSGHTSDVNRMAFTPDSTCLLSSSDDGTLRVWDVLTGQCVRVMQGYAVSLYCLDWSPDGTQVVSGGTDGVVTLWDVADQKSPIELLGHTWLVWGVGWRPDGNLVVSCGWDTVIRLWSPASRACVQTFECPSTTLTCMAWSPDGSLLAVGTFLQGMCVWDVAQARRRWVGASGRTAFISAAWSPDGSLLAGGDDDGDVYLWDGADGTLRERLSGHHGPVNCIAWSPDGQLLASGSSNRGIGEIFVWNVQGGQVCTYETGQGQAPSATVGDVGGRQACPTVKLAPASCAYSVSCATGLDSPRPLRLPVRTFVGHSDMVYALAWTHWDTDDRKGSSLRPLSACACLHDSRGNQLVSGGGDGRLYWWDLQSGECVNVQSAHQGTIRSLKVSPDGGRLASCGDDGTIQIWDLTVGTGSARGPGLAQGTGSAQGTIPTGPVLPLLRTLRRDRPYERLNITGIGGLTEAQKAALLALGAIE